MELLHGKDQGEHAHCAVHVAGGRHSEDPLQEFPRVNLLHQHWLVFPLAWGCAVRRRQLLPGGGKPAGGAQREYNFAYCASAHHGAEVFGGLQVEAEKNYLLHSQELLGFSE